MLFRFFFVSASLFAFAVASAFPAQTQHINVLLAPRQTQEPSPSPTLAPDGTYISTEHITVGGVTNDHITIPAQTIDIPIQTCIQTITPDANGYVPPGTCGAIWDYYPSFVAAAIFAVLFGTLTFVHIWQAARYKKASFDRVSNSLCHANVDFCDDAEILLGHHHGWHLGDSCLYLSRLEFQESTKHRHLPDIPDIHLALTPMYVVTF